jgi:hypothetical protein
VAPHFAFLCACSVVLSLSVVIFAENDFTTEAQSPTEGHRDSEIRFTTRENETIEPDYV